MTALPDGDRQPRQIDVGQQADLLAGELQHRALLIGQHDAAHAAADGKAGAGGAVDALDIGRTPDVADTAAQYRARAAEHQAPVEAAGRQRIAAAVEVQYATAAGAADDPSRL